MLVIQWGCDMFFSWPLGWLFVLAGLAGQLNAPFLFDWAITAYVWVYSFIISRALARVFCCLFAL
jgi:hypothetical protein